MDPSKIVLKPTLITAIVADFGAQAVVNYFIRQHFQQDSVLGEEDALELRQSPDMQQRILEHVNAVLPSPISTTDLLSLIDFGNGSGGKQGRFWTVDPIDGTKGFLRGEQFAVCLALIQDGQVQVGVLGCPNLEHHRFGSSDTQGRGYVFAAVRGQGAFRVCA